MARLAFRAKGSSDPAVVRRARQVVARYDDKQESAISTRRKEHEATYANVRYVIMVTAHRDEAVRMLHALRISFEKGA